MAYLQCRVTSLITLCTS